MPIFENDVNKIIAINTAYDLSGNTELEIIFTKPDGSTISKKKADGVSAPAVALTVKVDNVEVTFNANEYFSYPSESGLLTPFGRWKAQAIYTDGDPTNIAGEIVEFTVHERS